MAKNPSVIGIRGKTQGVRLSASPPRKSRPSVSGSPLEANVRARRSCGTGFFGAAVSGVKFALEGVPVCPAAAAILLMSMSALASLGGRQTLSLQA
jgi:hypothetical protein